MDVKKKGKKKSADSTQMLMWIKREITLSVEEKTTKHSNNLTKCANQEIYNRKDRK